MIDLYAYNISGIHSFREVADLLAFVSEGRRQVISRFHFDEDRIRSLFAGLLLRYALHEKYGYSESAIDRNEYGKPIMKEPEGVFFNLSHSGDWVFLGIGDCNLGVDVERMDVIDLSIADEFFSTEECTYIHSRKEADRLDKFYTIWTLKESYVKNIGKGLCMPLNHFVISQEHDGIVVTLHGQRDDSVWFQTRNIDAHHKIAWCVSGSGQEIENIPIQIVTTEQIQSFTQGKKTERRSHP